MIDLQDKSTCPTLEEIGEYVRNPFFMLLCSEIKDTYQCNEKIEYSSCSLEKGWNVKFKKAGRTLCTIYPRENYFTVMVVVGIKEKASVEEMLPKCTVGLQDIYHHWRGSIISIFWSRDTVASEYSGNKVSGLFSPLGNHLCEMFSP